MALRGNGDVGVGVESGESQDRCGTTTVGGKELKDNQNNHIMRLPIVTGLKAGGASGRLITATPTAKPTIPVIRELSVTPLAYRRFVEGSG